MLCRTSVNLLCRTSVTSIIVHSASCQLFSGPKRLVFPTAVLLYPLTPPTHFPSRADNRENRWCACTGEGGVRGGADREGPTLPRRPHRYTNLLLQPAPTTLFRIAGYSGDNTPTVVALTLLL